MHVLNFKSDIKNTFASATSRNTPTCAAIKCDVNLCKNDYVMGFPPLNFAQKSTLDTR